MSKRRTRIYEVPAEPNGEGHKKAYLVEAISLYEARDFVSKKYVGDATLPKGKRIAELMKSGVTVEPAK